MISEHLQACNCWGFGCPCVAESAFLCLTVPAGVVPVLPRWKHRICPAVWWWSQEQTLHRSLIAQDPHRIGGQGASCFDAMMLVFVKCYRQPFSKPVPSVYAYFDIIQCSAVFGGDCFKTTRQKNAPKFSPRLMRFAWDDKRAKGLAEPLQEDQWGLFQSPADLLSPWGSPLNFCIPSFGAMVMLTLNNIVWCLNHGCPS